jgi:hypothetical protein
LIIMETGSPGRMPIKNQGTHRLLIILTLLSLVLSPGRGTLLRKKMQRSPVTSNPVGAKVSVNGVEQGITPMELKLARKEKKHVIRIEYSGYNPVEIRAKRELSSLPTLDNGLLGVALAIPLAFSEYMRNDEKYNSPWGLWALYSAPIAVALTIGDLVSGAGYSFSPRELSVDLTEVDGAPRLETILLDSGKLQNVTWIRIHRN